MSNKKLTNQYEETIRRLLKKGKLRGRIDAKCVECIYDPYQEGTWRLQVEKCTSPACPLFPVRPLTMKGKTAGKEKAPASDQTERGSS